MSKAKILIQLDSDDQTSVFDSVVAVDAGVDQLFRHHSLTPKSVEALVHGAMFTRGPGDLNNTAIFVGGSNVNQGEALLSAVVDCFFGPMRVSVMMDSNGANTTAAAAVLAAGKHFKLSKVNALVLAATGPVGSRVVRLLASSGATILAASRSHDRAEGICAGIRETYPQANLQAAAINSEQQQIEALKNKNVVFACGAAGVELLSENALQSTSDLKVAIDMNAVPPLGISGIQVTDNAHDRNDILCYGAIGVGGDKMKIHKEAIRQLFQRNDLVLDAEEIFKLGQDLVARQ